MGNDLSTLGGAVVTTGTAVAAGVTFGQVQALNDALVDSAKYTAEHAEKTVVRHVGETLVMAVATLGTSVASGVTLGQVTALNDAVVHCAKKTSLASQKSGSELLTVADGLSDGIPGVGHVKGGICYAVGDKERGDRAMKSSSRSVSVLGGGVKGYLVGGPVGAIAGGIIAGAAMDGTITGIESSIHKEFRPHGQIASWNQVATAKNSDERIGGIVSGVMTPVTDGLSGYAAGKTVHMVRHHSHHPSTDLAKMNPSASDTRLMRIPGVKALKEAMNSWKEQAVGTNTVTDGAGGGFIKQATDALGGIFASSKAVEALHEAATSSSDKTQTKLQQLWDQARVQITNAIEKKFTDETTKKESSNGATATITGRLTGESGAFKGKEIVLALFVVYVAAIMLTAHK
ncbi:hypothetical protein Gpo141_00009485 [Globisporangium polare]